MIKFTTVSLEKETVEKIKSIGKKGQTYNEIINLLLETHMDKRMNSHTRIRSRSQ